MEPHDLSRETQANSRSARFGRKEWNKNPVLHFSWNAGTVVCHFDDDFASFADLAREFNPGFWLTGNGFHGISKEIDQYLFDQFDIRRKLKAAWFNAPPE